MIRKFGTSLVIQWLRLHTSSAGNMSSIPGQETEDPTSEQTLGDGGGQGSLECCNPWGHKELDMTE